MSVHSLTGKIKAKTEISGNVPGNVAGNITESVRENFTRNDGKNLPSRGKEDVLAASPPMFLRRLLLIVRMARSQILTSPRIT